MAAQFARLILLESEPFMPRFRCEEVLAAENATLLYKNTLQAYDIFKLKFRKTPIPYGFRCATRRYGLIELVYC